MTHLRIVYDGQCPFCNRYVHLLRLREHIAVELIDARADRERAQAYGFDLNEGMVADLDGQVHHAAEAVWLLSTLMKRPGIFANRSFARLIYPLLRAGRNATLHMLGRPRL